MNQSQSLGEYLVSKAMENALDNSCGQFHWPVLWVHLIFLMTKVQVTSQEPRRHHDAQISSPHS
jgi:hypothetical protein